MFGVTPARVSTVHLLEQQRPAAAAVEEQHQIARLGAEYFSRARHTRNPFSTHHFHFQNIYQLSESGMGMPFVTRVLLKPRRIMSAWTWDLQEHQHFQLVYLCTKKIL
jgi:hypothetical protein